MRKNSMINKRIIALALALCTAAAPLGAFAADDHTTVYSQLRQSFDERNWGKIKKLVNTDYRDVIESSDEFTININENKISKLNREVLGVQYEMNDNYNLFMKSQTDFTDSFKRAASETAPIPVVRMGGTSSNSVNYILNVGPVGQRKVTPEKKLPLLGAVQTGSQAMKMGPAEIIRAFQQTNPDVKAMPCIAYTMSGEDANHFAHYLLDDKDESEWGALRAADGIEEPVEVFYWELGNEIDGFGGTISNERIETYTSWAIEVIEAIKKDFPEQKFIACGKTACWMDFNRPEDDPLNRQIWQKMMFPILAPYVDGLSYHPYYDGHSSEYMMEIADRCKSDMDKTVEELDIRDKNGNLKDMVVVTTEASRWTDYSNADCILNCTYESAVYTSHYLNQCFDREWYAGSMFHNAITASWWCAYWQYNNGVWLSPTVKMMNMYNEELGDRLCEATFENAKDVMYNPESGGNEKYAKKNFSVIASPSGDNELKIFLTNRSEYTQRNIKFNFNNKYKLVAETVFSAPNGAVLSYDAASEKLTTVEKHEKNVDNFSEYQMNGMGVVVLTLRTDSKIPYKTTSGSIDGNTEIGDAPDVENEIFTDISDVYSKNEIAALANDGIISGKTETEFAPNDKLTNAELAAMLSKILGLNTNYTGRIWSDIPRGSWYEGAANALYVEGLVYGNSFNAFDAVTVRGLVQILGDYLINKDNVSVNSIVRDGKGLTPQGTYCVGKGLFDKYLKNTELDLSHTLTRAEAADVLYRFAQTVR